MEGGVCSGGLGFENPEGGHEARTQQSSDEGRGEAMGAGWGETAAGLGGGGEEAEGEGSWGQGHMGDGLGPEWEKTTPLNICLSHQFKCFESHFWVRANK